MTTMNSTRLNLTAAVVMLAALSAQAQERDFGDAPAPYPTLLLSAGAYHAQGPFPVLLGADRDIDSNGFPSLEAEGDDTNGADDEDGITFLDPLVSGRTARVLVHVNVPNAAYLDAWIDFNRNGQWTPLEKVFDSLLLPVGIHVLRVPVPRRAVPGPTYARFRLSSEGGLRPDGPAPSGEVEDYRVTITKPPVINNDRITIQPAPGGVTVNWDSPHTVLQIAPSPAGPWSVDLSAAGTATYPTDLDKLFFRTALIPGLKPNRVAGDLLSSLTLAADLVFDGTVAEVAYRNSSPLQGGGGAEIPHTFVTFTVHEVLKGSLAMTEVNGNPVPAPLCLRFAGGWDAGEASVMLTSRRSLFDVGERSILFVRLNNHVAHPLAGGNLGRYRVVNNEMFTASGSELVLSAENKIVLGARQDLQEVRENQVGQETFNLLHDYDAGEEPLPPPSPGQRIGLNTFKDRLLALIALSPPQPRPVWTPTSDIARPFHVPADQSSPAPVE